MNAAPFKNFPVLRTKRLSLERLTLDHLDQFIPIATFNGRKYETRKEVEGIIIKSDIAFAEKQGINWGIFLNSKLLGTCGFYRGFKDDVGEVGYILKEEFRNQGYTSEAIEEVVHFGFQKLELKKIVAFTNEQNGPSVALLTKLGFVKTAEKSDEYTCYERKVD
jgi:ribosomal-protein-alanine N-acetyltransferase